MSGFPTLTSQAAALSDGSESSVSLTLTALNAIKSSQSTLNAFRVVCTKTALAEAAEADKRLARGERLPLLGVPIAIKDDTDLAGTPTAFGTAGAVGSESEDAELVRRLRAAGAVIVGKTNTCELGQWGFTSGPGFGHTRNPWSRGHTPGGSSGGSAAAVAAGLVAGAIGSDGAGSVRIPAAWTHLIGIKPQRGRISTWPFAEAFNGITVHGPLARTVADAALLLDAASGNVPGDLHKPPHVRVLDAVHEDPGQLRIALSLKVPFSGFPAQLHPTIEAATRYVAHQLRSLGHMVSEGDPDYGVGLGLNFLPRATAGLLPWRDRLDAGAHWDPRTVTNMRTGRRLAGWALRRARAAEPRLQARVGKIFGSFNVVLAPTTAQPPTGIYDFDDVGSLATDRGQVGACPMTWPWNVLGWPSINVPAGFTADGLPIGVQLMGPANSEPLLISLAAQLESINNWASEIPDPWW
ncbi:amidase [Mycobacteroides abscessus]|uniref:amidase n=10 Tax=Mycobacteroides abscessus TaxID=36809 RepID=A0A1U6ASX3_9MYCO|nr:amidase [Mycobacteroides abscessus]ESV62865.1 amidase family protein [Mycobacteroides abscessus MAB_091912_2446]EUA71164.1 amidase family protein [Mycobacteroides abscessus subsp. bolletii 1513]AFN63066.1 amidase [Mycobacteroides abscessus subsp. massiliense str. GO 06]AMU25468.1 amidase [Mycobacteroides abscessus]AMU30543.1 amidase [Mycobacteroides abscessus]